MIITVWIEADSIKEIDQRVGKGLYMSRSEAIRVAIRDLLKDFWMFFDNPAQEEKNITGISFHLPKGILEIIKWRVDRGLYPNRSKMIREAIKRLLKEDLKLPGSLEKSSQENEGRLLQQIK